MLAARRVFLLAALLLAGCASTRPPVALSDLDANRRIPLRVGQSFVITLPADRSAGMGWTLAEKTLDILVLEGEPSYMAESGSGTTSAAAGSETWRFTALRKGYDELRFEYRHDDAADEAPTRVLRFEVTAR